MTTAPCSPALVASDLTMEFADGDRRLRVLRKAACAVWPGEIVTLEGPSGSGKSTLLAITGGLLTPTSGEVVLDGERAVFGCPPQLASLRRRCVGFVFQHFQLFRALTALEHLVLALEVRGSPARLLRRSAEQLLARVGLADRAHHRPSQLSGGQRQRLAIARAIAGSPKILLADEPTASLDDEAREAILALLQSLADTERMSQLVVTHDPAVARIAHRRLGLRGGVVEAIAS